MATLRPALLLAAAAGCLLPPVAQADAFSQTMLAGEPLALAGSGLGAARADATAVGTLDFTVGVATGESAPVRLSWRVDLLHLASGELAFAYQPGAVDAQGALGGAGRVEGMAAYDPGLSWPARNPYPQAGSEDRIVGGQSVGTDGLPPAVEVPEPGSLALFGLALLALALGMRRASGPA